MTPMQCELLWRIRLAMPQRRHWTCGYFMMVGVTTRQPSPRSDVSTTAGPRLLIHQVQYLLISQLTFISEGSFSIRCLGTRLVACSWPQQWLKQSWCNLQGITNSPHWWLLMTWLDSVGQRSSDSRPWRRHPRRHWGIILHLIVVLYFTLCLLLVSCSANCKLFMSGIIIRPKQSIVSGESRKYSTGQKWCSCIWL